MKSPQIFSEGKDSRKKKALKKKCQTNDVQVFILHLPYYNLLSFRKEVKLVLVLHGTCPSSDYCPVFARGVWVFRDL